MLHPNDERKEFCGVSSTWRFILRRVLLTACIAGILAPVGLVSAAQAAPGADESVDRIFAEALPGNRTEAPAPAPVPAMPLQVAKPAAQPQPVAPIATQGSISAPRPSVAEVIARPAAAPAPQPAPAAAPAARPAPAPAPAPAPVRSSAPVRTVSSTAYCLTGRMASGRFTYYGAAAMNGVPLGSRYQVLSGPRAGTTLVVEDRIGHSSGFDIAYPGNCGAARSYGRRTITIQQV